MSKYNTEAAAIKKLKLCIEILNRRLFLDEEKLAKRDFEVYTYCELQKRLGGKKKAYEKAQRLYDFISSGGELEKF